MKTLTVDPAASPGWSRQGFARMMVSTHPLANLNLLEAGQLGRQPAFPPEEAERRAYMRLYDKVSSTEGGAELLARVREIGAASGTERERDVIQKNTVAGGNLPNEVRGEAARFLMQGTNWELLRSLVEPTKEQARKLNELSGEYAVCRSFVDGLVQLVGGDAVVRKLAARAKQMDV